ncbi:MAG: DNA methyltransferase, partial [Parvularcula sp.]|nr:DNA methyltransferase [Parvularcula sp.]
MPTTAQLRTRLISKLKELFQLDQPDLDFGFYRIMHAKAEQVERFIDNDLLKIVDEAFAGSDKAKTESELDAAKRKLIEAMGEDALQGDGSVNPAFANTPAGKAYTEAVAKAGSQVASLSDEGQVYDHLFRFFERYYDNGDFVSRRYYTRETDGRAAPFAIPYNGEEVKLHWANADQYYIKTAEYFNNYTFDLTQAAEFRALNELERAGSGVPDKPVKVHFKIVGASEGEHGNVKGKDDDKRFFIIHQDQPIAFDENDELVVNFEYRADPDKGSKQEGSWRDFRNGEAVEVILKALEAAKGDNPTAPTCLQLFKAPAPTEKDKKRPLLAKYLNQYTARNTMDYFIHKNLGGFLRRELDFYIKNEVMRLDDLDQADAPAVESYLSKLKVLRKIAHKLIDFLAQLEDFQKKLWLKKKFVVETNYCITLDRVSEELYSKIAANDGQREEWVKLFAIDEIEASTVSPGFAEPLTVEFLKANNKLVLDTKFFDVCFKARLIESIEDFDAQCDGLLVHSENLQALNLLRETLKKQFKGIYIDPPYNTGNDGFVYRDAYQHSSWLSMVYDRVAKGREFATDEAAIFAAIDEGEQPNFRKLFDMAWGAENFIADMVWAAGRKNDSRLISVSHEYMLVYANNKPLLSERKIEWRQKKKGLDDIYSQHKKLKKEHGEDYAAMTEGLKA